MRNLRNSMLALFGLLAVNACSVTDIDQVREQEMPVDRVGLSAMRTVAGSVAKGPCPEEVYDQVVTDDWVEKFDGEGSREYYGWTHTLSTGSTCKGGTRSLRPTPSTAP